MTQFDNTNRGTLSRNDTKRPGTKDPDYGGKLNVDGVEYYLSGWRKTGKSKDGSAYDFMSLACKPAKPKQAKGPGPSNPLPIDDESPPF